MSSFQTVHGEQIQPTVSDLEVVRNLYEQGLYLQAYRLAEQNGPLHRWPGAAAKVLAGRLAGHVGAARLARRLCISAFRQAPDLPEARYYYSRVLLEKRGPLRAWYFLRQSGELPDGSPESQAHWLAFHCSVLRLFRDFDAAESWIKRAEALSPEDPWIAVERAYLLRCQDRYEEALQVAKESLQWKPWNRPGIQAAADLLVLVNRDREALELLLRASEQIESGSVVLQLAALQSELSLHTDAQRSYERYEELSPLLEKEWARWLRRGDLMSLITWAIFPRRPSGRKRLASLFTPI